MQIEWKRAAYLDVLDIADFINIDNPAAAIAVCDEICNQITKLRDNPNIGRLGRVPGTRELIINRTSYVAAYLVAKSAVVVLRVLHSARQWPKKLILTSDARIEV